MQPECTYAAILRILGLGGNASYPELANRMPRDKKGRIVVELPTGIIGQTLDGIRRCIYVWTCTRQ